MVSRDQIEQVRSAVNIVEVIREYVPSIKEGGRAVKGLCPFHSEKTPSFHVQAEKGFFKCFGCGESGDVIAFIAKMEQLSFHEALEALAAKAGITLHKSRVPTREISETSVREKLFYLLELASRFYAEQFWNETSGRAARAYVQERGLKEETVRSFQLGFAPASGVSAFESLLKKGFALELCQQAGLVARSMSGRLYDPLQGRLIFPIFDNFGHVIGFGGRVLPLARKADLGLGAGADSEPPKYINSPETPVFSKGKTLYGLHQAKPHLLASRRVLILEGYMDVIGVHQAGFPFAVASLGTALTGDHARLLKRYVDHAVAFFDPDEAGRRAALRGLEPLLQSEFFPRLVVTEEQDDPDDIILKKGAAFFSELINGAPDFIDYILDAARKTKSDAAVEDKAALARQLLGLIKHSPNEIYKAEWIRRVAQALNLRVDSLEREFAKRASKTAAPERSDFLEKKGSRGAAVPSIEDEFFYLTLNGAPFTKDGMGLSVEDFLEERHKRLFLLIKEQLEKEGALSVSRLYDHLTEPEKTWLVELSMEERVFSDSKERFEQVVHDMHVRRDRRRLAQMSQQISQGSAAPALMEEYKQLLRRIKGSVQTSEIIR